eukprot:6847023-Alexandrium_andersonii.AAC.1
MESWARETPCTKRFKSARKDASGRRSAHVLGWWTSSRGSSSNAWIARAPTSRASLSLAEARPQRRYGNWDQNAVFICSWRFTL